MSNDDRDQWRGGVMFEYINKTYGVPAAIGVRVTVDGNDGVIAEDRGHHVGVRFDKHPNMVVPCHPTWEIVYHTTTEANDAE